MIGPELTLQLVVVRVLAGLLIAMVQGASIAAVAVLLGDRGPRFDGRLMLLPSRHIDLLGLGSLMLTGFGWSRAVDIDPGQLRLGRWGLVIAALAGSAALLAAAWLILLLVIPAVTLLPHTAALVVAAFIRSAARLCVWMALFTLLPVPPLAGGQFLPAAGIRLPANAGLIIGCVLVAVSILGSTRAVLTPAYQLLAPLILGPDIVR